MASYLYILWDSWPISTSFHQLSAHLEMLVRSRKHPHPPTHIPWDSSNQLFKPWALARALPPTSQSWFRTGLDSGGHGPNWFTGLPLSIVKRYMLNNSGTVVARSFFFLFQFFYAHFQPGTLIHISSGMTCHAPRSSAGFQTSQTIACLEPRGMVADDGGTTANQ